MRRRELIQKLCEIRVQPNGVGMLPNRKEVQRGAQSEIARLIALDELLPEIIEKLRATP